MLVSVCICHSHKTHHIPNHPSANSIIFWLNCLYNRERRRKKEKKNYFNVILIRLFECFMCLCLCAQRRRPSQNDAGYLFSFNIAWFYAFVTFSAIRSYLIRTYSIQFSFKLDFFFLSYAFNAYIIETKCLLSVSVVCKSWIYCIICNRVCGWCLGVNIYNWSKSSRCLNDIMTEFTACCLTCIQTHVYNIPIKLNKLE